MINERMLQLGAQPSAIRELFSYGIARKAEIGADKVFDFSLGNPSIPTPRPVAHALEELARDSSTTVHGYTPAVGSVACRSAVAENLNRRFSTAYTMDALTMTMGAAASLDCCFHALAQPGDEIVVIAPYFPEYRMWIEGAGATCVEVPARARDFALDLEAIARHLGPRTQALVINSPNNPTGVVYDRESLEALGHLLRAARARLGHPIYLISDEPYRELVYDGVQTPWVPDCYEDTIVCYSWSKSFSLPGARIGYVLVPDEVSDATLVRTAIAGAGRQLGYVCAPSLFQEMIVRCVDTPVDVEPYDRNRRLLTSMLDELGFDYVSPQGAFYLWMKALEPDAAAFAEVAKSHELLLVPSDSFGVEGWVRIGYCVDETLITNSRAAFASLRDAYC